jgi:phospholipid transport system substrate-binding protein
MDGELATVATKILTKNNTEVPIDYRLLRRGDHWLVYDVNIEGVSLVSNYRTQFNKIIQTTSYNDLVQKMRTKQHELVSSDQGPPRKPSSVKQ